MENDSSREHGDMPSLATPNHRNFEDAVGARRSSTPFEHAVRARRSSTPFEHAVRARRLSTPFKHAVQTRQPERAQLFHRPPCARRMPILGRRLPINS
jgi:hypothetical protein